MSTNTIKPQSATKDNDDMINMSEFQDAGPGYGIDMNLSSAKMTFSKDKIIDETLLVLRNQQQPQSRHSLKEQGSAKKIVSSKLQMNYQLHGSHSNANW